MLTRVDFITDDLSLSLSFSFCNTRITSRSGIQRDCFSLSQDLNPKLVETHFPMKLSLDIIPGKPKWRCFYVGRVYTVVLGHSIDFKMPFFHRQTFPTSRSKLCWSLLAGNLVFSASISSSMLKVK